jgi:hypothetical protein
VSLVGNEATDAAKVMVRMYSVHHQCHLARCTMATDSATNWYPGHTRGLTIAVPKSAEIAACTRTDCQSACISRRYHMDTQYSVLLWAPTHRGGNSGEAMEEFLPCTAN